MNATDVAVHVVVATAGVGAIVWGAEMFAEHLARAAARLGVSMFALALLLAGAEPEELATAVTAAVRDAPAIAVGDVIGANVTICLVALGVGAVVTPLPFGRRVLRYALLGLPVGIVSAALAWDGSVTRLEGAVLAALYVVYVAAIWIAERRPPSLGETGEIDEAAASDGGRQQRRVGRELALVLAGLGAMVVGASLFVDAIKELVGAEADQARLSVTLVGFVTGFELVVLAWSAARRGISDAVVAAVVGSYAYNATATLGVAAVVRPLTLADAELLRPPWAAMVVALAAVLVLAGRRGVLTRRAGVALLAAYPMFVVLAILL